MSEPKYIDANELRAMMYHGAFEEDSDLQRWDGGCWIRYKMFEKALEQIGAADVVPVVRCKDCIHYMPYDWMFSEVRKSENINDYPKNEIGCEWIDHHINPEGYCSYGERKDG